MGQTREPTGWGGKGSFLRGMQKGWGRGRPGQGSEGGGGGVGKKRPLRGEKSFNIVWNLIVCVPCWAYKAKDALSFKEGFISGTCPCPWHRRLTSCCHGQVLHPWGCPHLCRALQPQGIPQPLELHYIPFYSCFYTKAGMAVRDAVGAIHWMWLGTGFLPSDHNTEEIDP